MDKKVLFITEGPVDEPHLIRLVCKDMNLIKDEGDFYPYCKDIHQFADLLIPPDKMEVDASLDLLLTLKEKENDPEKKEILSRSYTDIYIVFDFDPQANRQDYEKLCALAMFFTESSDMGRLYINYPMMQSYKHLKSLPDLDFQSRRVERRNASKYKETVEQEAAKGLTSAHSYNHNQLYSMAVHHLRKRELVLGRPYKIPDQYLGLEDCDVLRKQIQMIEEEDACWVLNTSILIYLGYRPKQFLNEVKCHVERFLI